MYTERTTLHVTSNDSYNTVRENLQKNRTLTELRTEKACLSTLETLRLLDEFSTIRSLNGIQVERGSPVPFEQDDCEGGFYTD